MVVNIRNFLCGCKGCLHGDGPCVNEVCPQDWWAYDLKNKKYVNPILDTWNVQLTCKIPLLEQNANYWLEQIQELSKIVSYRTLQDHIETNPLPHLILKETLLCQKVINPIWILLHFTICLLMCLIVLLQLVYWEMATAFAEQLVTYYLEMSQGMLKSEQELFMKLLITWHIIWIRAMFSRGQIICTDEVH